MVARSSGPSPRTDGADCQSTIATIAKPAATKQPTARPFDTRRRIAARSPQPSASANIHGNTPSTPSSTIEAYASSSPVVSQSPYVRAPRWRRVSGTRMMPVTITSANWT